MSTTISSAVSPSRARDIMGSNYLGPLDVSLTFSVHYTDGQLESLAAIPFSGQTLFKCRDTHVLVPGAPLSVHEIRKFTDVAFYSVHEIRKFEDGGFYDDTGWHDREPFADDKKVGVRWYLLRKEAVPESGSKTYREQTALLMKDEEEVPFACEVIYMVVLYYWTYGERLLPDVYVRCQDKDLDGYHVYVGSSDCRRFGVSANPGGFRVSNLGLASMRKPDVALPTT